MAGSTKLRMPRTLQGWVGLCGLVSGYFTDGLTMTASPRPRDEGDDSFQEPGQ